MKPPPVASLVFGVIPFVAICFSVPLWDRVHPMVAGLPFNLAWLIVWTALTPLSMWCAYRIERRRK